MLNVFYVADTFSCKYRFSETMKKYVISMCSFVEVYHILLRLLCTSIDHLHVMSSLYFQSFVERSWFVCAK